MYLLYLSLLSKGSLHRVEESQRSSTSNRKKSTRGENIKRNLYRCMEYFLVERGSCSYDVESIDGIKDPLKYTHLVKQWVPKDLCEVNINFFLNERIYGITLSSLHGLGIFSMDGINVCYRGLIALMEYVRPCYNYKYLI